MKKWLALILAAALLLSFAGCAGAKKEEEKEPLRVCVDMEYLALGRDVEKISEALSKIISRLVFKGGPQGVKIEMIPCGSYTKGNTEREIMISRIRTEIMAGEGPDIFIASCPSGIMMQRSEPLFTMPEKAMESGLFLPLDEYIENAQFMEWDKLAPEIMEAGRNEYGQQILPLSYTMPLTYFRESEVEHMPTDTLTWQDMLQDESGVMKAAANWIREEEYFGIFPLEGGHIDCALGKLIDHRAGELLFTEEELLQRTKEMLELADLYDDGVITSGPSHYTATINTQFKEKCEGLSFNGGIAAEEPLTMVPIYADDGGCSANIVSFAAINVNTKQPEEAFMILDFLLSLEIQQTSELYTQFLYFDSAIPVHTELMQESCPVVYSDEYLCCLDEESFASFTAVREQVTHAHFNGTFEMELDNMMMKCLQIHSGETDGDIEKVVADYYDRLGMLAAE